MTHLVVTYGYLAVFVLVAAESLGIPVPGETAMIVAAGYAGESHRLSAWLVFVAGGAGAIVGDNFGYWIGAKGGYRLLRRWGPRLRIDDAKIKVGWYVFSRHGAKVVFFGRWVSVLRAYAAFLAGVNRMRWRRFTTFNVTGGILWAGVYTFVSFRAGRVLARASTYVTVAGVVIIVVALVTTAVVVRRGTARLAQRAEAAFPGPLDGAFR